MRAIGGRRGSREGDIGAPMTRILATRNDEPLTPHVSAARDRVISAKEGFDNGRKA
jgi:hypothetical protein